MKCVVISLMIFPLSVKVQKKSNSRESHTLSKYYFPEYLSYSDKLNINLCDHFPCYFIGHEFPAHKCHC